MMVSRLVKQCIPYWLIDELDQGRCRKYKVECRSCPYHGIRDFKKMREEKKRTVLWVRRDNRV